LQTTTGSFGRRYRALALAVIGTAATSPAFALYNDYIEVWAAENWTRDTNVFRLSDKVDPASVGATQRGDNIWTTYFGVVANVPWAQQRFEGAYTWSRADYDVFDRLDHDAYSARAAWDYNFQNKVTGVASYTQARSLASFSNFQLPLRDLVTVKQGQVTGAWLATPRWRADGRYTAVETDHSDPFRSINNIRSQELGTGLSYVTPQDNLIGASLRYQKGESPDNATLPGTLIIGQPIIIGQPFNNEYDQWGAGATTTWIFTPQSRFEGRVEWIRRRYTEFTQRNYTGPTAKALYKWTPTPKFTLETVVQRDVGPPEEIQTSFVLVTGGYVRPKWAITEKIFLQGNAEYEIWDYRGDPLTGGNFTHRSRIFSGSVQWKPWQRIWFSAGVSREVRTSTLLFGDYQVTVGFIEGRIGF